MNRQFLFDKALFTKRIGSIGSMVVIDVSYFLSGAFFGLMDMKYLLKMIMFFHILLTCMLYHIFIVSRGQLIMELNTEKMVYFPTTREKFLQSKYAISIILLVVQLGITLVCLGIGYLGSRGQVDMNRILGSLLTVFISIMLTSGAIILIMHVNPMALFLPLLLFFPFSFILNIIIYLLDNSLYLPFFLLFTIVVFIWMLLLNLGKKIYEKVN